MTAVATKFTVAAVEGTAVVPFEATVIPEFEKATVV
jgi:hypothetical protein